VCQHILGSPVSHTQQRAIHDFSVLSVGPEQELTETSQDRRKCREHVIGSRTSEQEEHHTMMPQREASESIKAKDEKEMKR